MYYRYPENKSEFDKLRINGWHNAGILGKNVCGVILDNQGYPAKEANIETPLPLSGTTGHLTHVSWVWRMVAPKARLIALTLAKDVDKTFNYLKEHKGEIDLINCSFNIKTISLKEKMEKFLAEFNKPVLCAAGNNSEPSPLYPASSKYAIAIGAASEKTDDVVSYSARGAWAVAYTNIKIPSYTGVFPGTSCADPVASGQLSLVIDVLKEEGLRGYNLDEAKKHIDMVSKDIREKGFDNVSGNGIYGLPDVSELYFRDEAKGYRSSYFDPRQWV